MRFPPANRGFSLPELLVVIAVIAVLLALGVGQLGQSKRAAVSARVLGDMRSHGAVFAVYNSDWRDAMPYVTNPKTDYTELHTSNFSWNVRYFDAFAFWHVGLADGYYHDDILQSCFHPPGYPATLGTPYKYSVSFLAEPNYWNTLTRTGPAQWKCMHAADVAFPSKKGQLINWASAIDNESSTISFGPSLRTETGFCDGSARVVPYRGFLAYVRDGDGPFGPPPRSIGQPVLHTLLGCLGKDVE